MGGRRAATHESGFTLVEVLAAMAIFGVLVTVAVASYSGVRSRGQLAAAQSNVGAARSAVEAYYAERGSYTGMTLAALRTIDPEIALSKDPVVAGNGKRYCIESTHNGTPPNAATSPGMNPYSLTGPGGSAQSGGCPATL